MSKKKILVVDDDEGVLDAISLILEEAGYSVDTSLKGEETYRIIDSFKPDLILLDVLMSGNDGRVICKKLKKTESTRRIPIIMISAHPTAEADSLEYGAQDFLAKPFDTQDLLKLIKKHI